MDKSRLRKPIGLFKVTAPGGENHIINLYPVGNWARSEFMCAYWPQDVKPEAPAMLAHIRYDTKMTIEEVNHGDC